MLNAAQQASLYFVRKRRRRRAAVLAAVQEVETGADPVSIDVTANKIFIDTGGEGAEHLEIGGLTHALLNQPVLTLRSLADPGDSVVLDTGNILRVVDGEQVEPTSIEFDAEGEFLALVWSHEASKWVITGASSGVVS